LPPLSLKFLSGCYGSHSADGPVAAGRQPSGSRMQRTRSAATTSEDSAPLCRGKRKSGRARITRQKNRSGGEERREGPAAAVAELPVTVHVCCCCRCSGPAILHTCRQRPRAPETEVSLQRLRKLPEHAFAPRAQASLGYGKSAF